jgi:hypothetical protein
MKTIQKASAFALFVFAAAAFSLAAAQGPREDLQSSWDDLGSGDGAAAYRAIGRFLDVPDASVSFLGKRLRPVAALPREGVRKLIADLGSEQFIVRDKANRQLEDLRELAWEELEMALAAGPELEVRRRIERMLEKKELLKSPERLQTLRAIEILEGIGTPDAKAILQKLADGAPETEQAKEAKASVRRLIKRGL